MQYTFYAFDTDCIVHIEDEHDPEQVKQLFLEIQNWHATFNVFDEASEVSRFNRAGDTFQGSPLFYSVLQEMISYRDSTSGYFEPFVEVLLSSFRANQVITDEESARYIHLHDEGKITFLDDFRIEKSDPEIKVNFHSFLKGYACDYMRSYLYDQLDVRHFLIDFGGNLLAEGLAGEGEYWRVGIQHPSGVRNELIDTMDLLNESLVTSASYERPLVIQETLQSHMIDPNSGMFLPYSTCSVSVKSASSTVADVLSTVLTVCQEDERKALLKMHKAQAFIFENDQVIRY